jgi:hypothetical protein
MAITLTTAMCSSFKKELLFGAHDFATGGDTFKIGLFKAEAGATGTFGAATTNYADVTSATAENTGTGYTAAGINLTNVDPTLDSTTAITDFNDAEWTSSTITSFGAFIYNSTPNTGSISLTNPMVAILAFGADKSSSSGTFQVVFPNADQNNAIIRIA